MDKRGENPAREKERLTHFGRETVAESTKAGRVSEVFSSVAKNYDLMNDLMSAGIHRLWKDAFVAWLSPRPGWAYADVAGGTGDIARRIAACVAAKGKAAITVIDANEDMLAAGRARAKDEPGAGMIAWLKGDAETLPLKDASIDAYTIAFGIRNVTRIEAALGEAARVLKPGGRFLCLEFSTVAVPGLDDIYELYSSGVLPQLGDIVAGDREAYQYLVDSIRRFPDQKRFATLIAKSGLAQVKWRNLSGGIAAMHSAFRL